MRPPSSNSEDVPGLLGPLFAAPASERELSDNALVQAMLDAESALSKAESAAGVIPAGAARAITEACERLASRLDQADVDRLGRDAQASGNPVVPLVRALTAELPADARPWVHYGTTSQDIVDTALMLVARRCGIAILGFATDASRFCADLAEQFRNTVMPARTLGQQAGLTTFGMKAATWLSGFDDATTRLHDVVYGRLAVQLGGATGNLGVLGGPAAAVVERFGAMLHLEVPAVPWHTDRQRILDLAAALAALVAVAGKLALDVQLLSQTEIGEVAERSSAPGEERHGSSSALPHKHNSVDAVLIRSAALYAPNLLATIFNAAAQHEHERAAGAWHAEWQPLRELFSITGGSLARTTQLLSGLDVRAEKMRENLDASSGLLFAEQVATRLMPALGRSAAQGLVAGCCEVAVAKGMPLRDVMASDDEMLHHLSVVELDELFDPATALGAIDALIDRALAAHARRTEIGRP
jgi:3-carboxy-cis,cis-muconate cycloisomerase